MKKTLLLTLITGFLLVAGLSGYLVSHRTGSTNAEKPEAATVLNSSAPATSNSLEQVPVAPVREITAADLSQPEAVVQVVSASGDRFQPIHETQILDRRITTISKDRKKRELLVKADGKYPFHRVEEILVKNENADTYTVFSRTEMVANHVLVKLQDGKNADDLRAMLKGYGVSILRELSLPGHYIVSLKAPTLDAVPEALSVFSRETGVLVYVEPDYISRISAVPNDSRWGDLWGMVKINATGAWDTATGSTNVVVAVIDTGIDLTHPDLVANLWRNMSEVNGITGLDDDGNGRVDDIYGWDFANDDNTPADDNSHGTHCAGTVGAVGNNSLGVVGVCWKVRLMALKAGSAAGVLMDSDIAEAIRYASDKKVNVISASFGGGGASDTMRDAITYANGKGVLFVAAAGNSGSDNDSTPVYPASYDIPNIVAVGATDQNDVLASFSCYGKTSVDLVAPGVNIYSTVPNGNFGSDQGTSMATPHVAGAAALLLSSKPSLTPLQLKAALLNTVDSLPALAAKTVSGGRLNVKKLIALQDSDGDGMPDEWEIANGLNQNDPSDAILDPDNDHLNNRAEYENRCTPHNADTDGDSLFDGWEVTYGFSPNSPTGSLAVASTVGGFNTAGDAKNIAVDGSYAYVADGANGLVILNIADPKNPVQVGWYDHSGVGTANDVAVSNGYAYVADGANGLVIVNVSTPSAPALAGWTNTVGTAEGVAVQGNYVYLADGINELVVFDVSNPASIQQKGKSYTIRNMHDVYARGSHAYIAMFEDVKRYVVSPPVSLNILSDKAAYPNGFTGWTLTGVHGSGSIIAAVAGVNGVKIMNTNLVVLGSYDTEGSAAGVFVSGNSVYVADGTNGLVVLNIYNSTNLVLAAHVSTAGSASGVFVSGGYTYVTEGTTGVEIFSILPDSDGDGLLDSWEISYFENLGQSATNDYDGDGITERGEYLAGLNPKNADQDADGLTDGTQEVRLYNTDPRKVDTDGDGLVDGNDGFVPVTTYPAGVDANTNLFVDGELDFGTDPLDSDTDHDGMNDGWEVRYHLNPRVPGGAGDTDSDGLTDVQESQNNTDPGNRDTDGDGMWDGWEVLHGLNPNDPSDAALDPDSDGLTNLQEYNLGTDPRNNDTDGDGMPDGWEYTYRPTLNPTNSLDVSLDPDGDGLVNRDEYSNNCNPTNRNTDVDGMPDGWEVNNGLLASSATGANGASGDPDSDGLLNLQEYSLCSNSLWSVVYTSVTGAPSSFSFTNTTPSGMPGSTHPNKRDSDGDGLDDYWEVTTNAAINNLYITNPNNPDTDGDGFSDGWEVGHGFKPLEIENPVETDRDGDGLTDKQEIDLGTQPYNSRDPVFVDDNAENDPAEMDPQTSDPLENGTWGTNSVTRHPFDSIQKAINTNVTVDGMTILIADGTYWGEGNYNIDTHGKAITIKSWSNNPSTVIINSAGAGPVFTMNSGETTNTVIKGLGITVTINPCSDDCDAESGIILSNASPRIENCTIYGCALDGIRGERNSSPVIQNCTISNVLNGVWCTGGSSPRIENCTITDIGHGTGGDFGIGIYVDGSSGVYIGGTNTTTVSDCNGRGISLKDSANATIFRTTVTNNSGGITCDNSSPRIERCMIMNNEAPNYYIASNKTSVVARQLFPSDLERANDKTDEDENGGGILLMRDSSPFMVNCLVVGNRTWAEDSDYSKLKLRPDFGLGGGFYIGDGCSPTGVNCTVADNHANTLGGGLTSLDRPFFRNMIFWGNTFSDAMIVGNTRVASTNIYMFNLHCRSGSINIWYSDIEGPWWPNGYPSAVLSTNGNPLFVGGGNYNLTDGSPCTNKGTFYLAPSRDLDGKQRSTTNLSNRIDMGCYEFNPEPPSSPLEAAESIAGIAAFGGAAPDPLADDDGDGVSNGDEKIAGTAYEDANSYFRVYHQQSLVDGSVLITWQSVSDNLYTVQSTDNLISGSWSNEAGYTDKVGTGGIMTFSAVREGSVRYYRVLVSQPQSFTISGKN